jgi:hypothetical protein
MEPISNADRLVLLLRTKLEERARTGRASKGRAKTATPPKTPISGVKALAAIEDDGPALRRAVVQHLLADQLGPDLLNDAQFQQIVSRVAQALEEDDATKALLGEVVASLKSSS